MSKLQFNSQGFITGFKKMTKAPASPCRLRTKSSYLKGMLRKIGLRLLTSIWTTGIRVLTLGDESRTTRSSAVA